ncbi:hypothetical protein A2U01_0080282, partial [Trifolium medium]|nr:hypothetical protein [Trifolium medium]
MVEFQVGLVVVVFLEEYVQVVLVFVVLIEVDVLI